MSTLDGPRWTSYDVRQVHPSCLSHHKVAFSATGVWGVKSHIAVILKWLWGNCICSPLIICFGESVPDSNLTCLYCLMEVFRPSRHTESLVSINWVSVLGSSLLLLVGLPLLPVMTKRQLRTFANQLCMFLVLNLCICRTTPPSGLPKPPAVTRFSKEWYYPREPFLLCSLGFTVLYSGGTCVEWR